MKYPKEFVLTIVILLSVAGIFDTALLTKEHFAGTIAPCSPDAIFDCGMVLNSKYSQILGIPLALIGLFFYTIEAIIAFLAVKTKKNIYEQTLLVISAGGFLVSIVLVYLMAFVLGAYCLNCLISAVISTLIFAIVWSGLARSRRLLVLKKVHLMYKYGLRRILFAFDAEIVHTYFVSFGRFLGGSRSLRRTIEFWILHKDRSLRRNICGIKFASPVGLAAGFDYNADLTQILPSLGFGFATVGTITNKPYKGNPRPMLGRLPKSKSLMVNKGFKNEGADKIIKKLEKLNFDFPVGISIGRTNTRKLVTLGESIEDIVDCFSKFEKSKVGHSYYELNISCPNLFGNISFYPPKNLKRLVARLEKININKPVFVKMPIEKNDKEVLAMLSVLDKSKLVSGVIFGNLQKDRNDSELDINEVNRFKTGNFSGRPTFKRSNELIKLTRKHFKKRFAIIGCGGIFDANDASAKLQYGADLVQLITGLVYEGPQLPAQINMQLSE